MRHEYVDHGFGGTKSRRPALDRMLDDARRRRFDVLIVWSCDRLARSTKHFLQVLDELDSCGVQFVSLREAFDTSGALGRAFLGIVAVLGEMERALLIERVRSGMARARAEGRPLPALPNILASHALIHTAEGEFFRRVVREACESCHIPVMGIRERELDERANATFGKAAAGVRQHIAALGKIAGSPWTQDEKTAALAASVVSKPMAQILRRQGRSSLGWLPCRS